MIRHPEGQPLQIVVPFVDANGAALAVSQVGASLFDGEDGWIADLMPEAWAPGDTSATFRVAATHLALPARALRAAFTLSVMLLHANGLHEVFHDVIVEAGETIAVMVNSFQSYAAAEMLALETHNATGWAGASELARKAALAEAFRRITGIPMRYTHFDLEGIPLGPENYIDRAQWSEIDQVDFKTFPSAFRRALQLAQFLEANELLAGDVIGDRRRAGIVAESIGESSMQLNVAQLDFGVSRAAMQALTGYIHFSMRIGRS